MKWAALLLSVSLAFGSEAQSIDPAAERIWDNEAESWIDFETLIDRLEVAPRIIIGERHGFAPHQNRIALILQALAERGRYPRLVIEQLKPSQMDALDAYREENPEYAGGLGLALEWWDTGWPAFKYYEPIFAVAFAARLEIVAGSADNNLPKAENAQLMTYWRDRIQSSSCVTLDQSVLEARVAIQHAKDIAVGKALRDEVALAIVGNDHLSPNSIPSLLDALTPLEFRTRIHQDGNGTGFTWLVKTPQAKPCPT